MTLRNDINHHLEEFFLRGIAKYQNITVKKALLKTMSGFLLAAILIWIGFHLIAYYADNDLNVFVFNVLFFPLIPIALLLSNKTVAFSLKNYLVIIKKQENNIFLIKSVSILCGMIGIGIMRFLHSRLTLEAIDMLFIIIIIILLLLMIYCAGLALYKIKYIKQYCPDLLNRIV